jgi:hypothetical protein
VTTTATTTDRIERLAQLLGRRSAGILPRVPVDVRERMFRYALSGAAAEELLDAYGDLVVRDGYRRCAIRTLPAPFAELLKLTKAARDEVRHVERRIGELQTRRDEIRQLLDF